MRNNPDSDHIMYGWEEFNYYADSRGISENPDDWTPWWACWRKAWTAAEKRTKLSKTHPF